jgi:hypothetical protein
MPAAVAYVSVAAGVMHAAHSVAFVVRTIAYAVRMLSAAEVHSGMQLCWLQCFGIRI